MYCKNCGKKLNKGEKYCTYCGEALEEEIINEPNQTINSSNNTSLILGIISCIFFWIPFLSIPLAIVSIITGISQKKESNKFSVGIILGIISIILTIIMIFLIIFLFTFAIDHIDDALDDYQIDNIIDNYHDIFNSNQELSDIKGYSWLADDNSVLYLNEDNTYIWYLKDSDHEDNYYQGKVTTYKGEEAIQYIATNLKEFNLTEEEQRKFFEKEEHTINDYYIMILTCEKAKMNGKETDGTTNTAYYYGFYSKENKYLDLTNLSTKAKSGFTLKEKINDIDV